MITIDHQMLLPETLNNFISEVVLREGVDYGMTEVSFEDKKRQLLRQLQQGEAMIIYDSRLNECDIVSIEKYQKLGT